MIRLSADAEEIGYAVVLRQGLGNGREISVQFNMGLGAEPKLWNGELDKLTGVMDRQIARAEVPQREEELKAQLLVREIIAKDIGKLQSTLDFRNKNTEVRPTGAVPPEVAKIDAQKDVLEKTERKIEELKTIISELKKKAA